MSFAPRITVSGLASLGGSSGAAQPRAKPSATAIRIRIVHQSTSDKSRLSDADRREAWNGNDNIENARRNGKPSLDPLGSGGLAEVGSSGEVMGSSSLTPTRERQLLCFESIQRHRLPRFFGDLFGSSAQALDFLQAFVEFEFQRPEDTWSREKVLPQIRQQALRMSPRRFRDFVQGGLARWRSRSVDPSVLILPLSSSPGDISNAVRVYNLVLDTAFSHAPSIYDFIEESLIILAMLIVRQRDLQSWSLLVEGVREGREAASEAFRKLLGLWLFVGITPRFVAVSSYDFSWARANKGGKRVAEKLLVFTDDPRHPRENRIPAPDNCVSVCNRLYRERQRQCQPQQEALISLASWFQARQEDFRGLAADMWQDIRSDAKYGLRPNGRDVLRIEVKALRDNGYRSVQFFPQPEFPKVCARFWIEMLDLGVTIVVDRMLEPNVTLTRDKSSESQGFQSTLAAIQEFIALHGFWSITTGLSFHGSGGRSRAGGQGFDRKFLVRPHFRSLPAGFHPTERALRRSVKTFGYMPPPGKTFVKSDFDGQEAADKTVGRPVLTYRDDDLGYVQ